MFSEYSGSPDYSRIVQWPEFPKTLNYSYIKWDYLVSQVCEYVATINRTFSPRVLYRDNIPLHELSLFRIYIVNCNTLRSQAEFCKYHKTHY